jgi:chromate reductase
MNKLSVLVLFIATLLFYKLSFAAPLCRVIVHNSQVQSYAQEITVVIGTDRKNSNSSIVAKEMAKQLAESQSVRVNVINLIDLPKSMFGTDYFAKKSAYFENNFVKPIVKADGVIFVIPEYDGAVPGVLSYYLNHMRSSFDKKQVALVGVSAGKWGARSALDSFKGTLTHRRARVLGDLQINIEQVESKIANSQITDRDSKIRIADTARELIKSLNQNQNSISAQKSIALLAVAAKDKKVQLTLNNSNSVEGVLSNIVLNENGTPAYVQFSGPTKIKNKDAVIQGQDVDVHNLGYGMPVGAIKGFKKEWYKKANLDSANLKIGARVKLEYESEVIVNGVIKKLTLDAEGNLLVLTFSDVTVKNGRNFLFEKSWGDFDIAVADYIEQISLQ